MEPSHAASPSPPLDTLTQATGASVPGKRNAAPSTIDDHALLADLERAYSGSDTDEGEQISVRLLVGDSPEEVVDVDPTADVLQTLRRELGIKGAACKLLPVDPP